MREETGYVAIPALWEAPCVLASVNIDPTRYSHLLIYEKYCQVVVGHVVSPGLNKSDVEIILDEMKGLMAIHGLTRSKLSAVKYTPSSVRVGQCTVLGKVGFDGLMDALQKYLNDGPYPKNFDYVKKTDTGKEIITKERIGSVSLHAWWDFKDYAMGSSMQMVIVGPYEIFSFGFSDKSILTKLSDAIQCLIETDVHEVKIDTKPEWPDEVNLRVFKQSVCGDPAVCISTDSIMGNQRSLIFIGKESGARFLKFLKKSKQMVSK